MKLYFLLFICVVVHGELNGSPSGDDPPAQSPMAPGASGKVMLDMPMARSLRALEEERDLRRFGFFKKMIKGVSRLGRKGLRGRSRDGEDEDDGESRETRGLGKKLKKLKKKMKKKAKKMKKKMKKMKKKMKKLKDKVKKKMAKLKESLEGGEVALSHSETTMPLESDHFYC
ncbi:uncharacterized protein LOC122259539 [Penaeus japonicus]|uniref:uncharacterized protein LOC122259539 n=1 Tax=Penaeus japonicus TaxID=27405 RepID=UPI001C71670D|nr:uncharacterized protein LOC122259539 [Penaeus japonicus]